MEVDESSSSSSNDLAPSKPKFVWSTLRDGIEILICPTQSSSSGEDNEESVIFKQKHDQSTDSVSQSQTDQSKTNQLPEIIIEISDSDEIQSNSTQENSVYSDNRELRNSILIENNFLSEYNKNNSYFEYDDDTESLTDLVNASKRVEPNVAADQAENLNFSNENIEKEAQTINKDNFIQEIQSYQDKPSPAPLQIKPTSTKEYNNEKIHEIFCKFMNVHLKKNGNEFIELGHDKIKDKLLNFFTFR